MTEIATAFDELRFSSYYGYLSKCDNEYIK